MKDTTTQSSTQPEVNKLASGSKVYLIVCLSSFAFYLVNILAGWASIRFEFPVTPLDVVPEALLLLVAVVSGVIFVLLQEKHTQ
ncbi:hypothetical protein MADA3029_1020020 [Vibrio nigripulchritudo MADA3029]|nr:hypothetical protein [Vibrio nigripulchritudo]CCN50177.1 hypothetical protein VIBNIMADA3020_860003 [Vibrio nigripulchritudo MADA3020]CCN51173.1 hypothetical protein VIBNIMADA3021_100070 [Vibrio nigripulchritudo MADA3021]CCN56853.1 hypothetical protein MADA3029_1020020 [Vibrio nigripulchritudo MADA3029]CCN71187.1 hypothetical protein VIBNISFn118_300165 [Vibrio nigripulchritudo SFn118]